MHIQTEKNRQVLRFIAVLRFFLWLGAHTLKEVWVVKARTGSKRIAYSRSNFYPEAQWVVDRGQLFCMVELEHSQDVLIYALFPLSSN